MSGHDADHTRAMGRPPASGASPADGHGHDGHGHDTHHGHGPEVRHAHGHPHGGHRHPGLAELGSRALLVAVVLNVGLTLAEGAIGVWAGSLALVADAVHNLGDAAALVVAFGARLIARRGADDRYTFGYRRAELIGALVNLTSLILLGGFLVVEAVERLLSPAPVQTGWVMLAGAVAVVVDLGTAALLWRFAEGSMNMRAAFVHNLMDAATSVAVVAGAAIVASTGLTFVDPLLSLVIAGVVLVGSARMLRTTAHILMEGAPAGLDVDAMSARLVEVEGVLRVHHVHAWQLDETHRAVEAHVVLDDAIDRPGLERVRAELRRVLHDEFEVGHATIELEWPDSACGDDAVGRGFPCGPRFAAPPDPAHVFP